MVVLLEVTLGQVFNLLEQANSLTERDGILL